MTLLASAVLNFLADLEGFRLQSTEKVTTQKYWISQARFDSVSPERKDLKVACFLFIVIYFYFYLRPLPALRDCSLSEIGVSPLNDGSGSRSNPKHSHFVESFGLFF